MKNRYLEQIEQKIADALSNAHLPPVLGTPIAYALQSGGKRLRPLITMLAADACGSTEDATPAAAAIEILHNFTLVHDDIMDRSPLRRGKPTVFTQWDEATAILAGDTMMGIAYAMLSSYYSPPICQRLVAAFSTAFVEICIGQAEDLAFRSTPTVSMDDYLGMISRKTARLFATAAVAGGIVAMADQATQQALDTIGTAIGIAFQVQDDMLDLFGTPEFGKQRGQDLREGKKTYPILCAVASTRDNDDRVVLERYLAGTGINSDEDIEHIAAICRRAGVLQQAQATINHYIEQAQAILTAALPPTPARAELITIADTTRTRQL
ncbi:MAG: polyprenyl synthetase [Candidatus Kapaibacterium sp.]|nr:MAG: polyprenyl synthetase [Candidatus Kapabacteria bacterium]